MKKQLLILILALFSTGIYAQQDEIYTQFYSNALVLNPAYAGSREAISVLALYRNQWVGFDGAPKALSFSVHSPIFRSPSGIGFTVLNDKIGIFQNLYLSASYAYRVEFPFGKVSLGLNGRIRRIQTDWYDTNPLDPNDAGIPYTDNNQFIPNFGTGAYFYNDFMYAGFSVPHLIESKLTTMGGDDSKQLRQYIAMVGGVYTLTDDLKLRPGLIMKYVKNSPFQMDMSMGVIFFDMFMAGVSVRSKDSFSGILQAYLNNKISIGYAHDFSYTKLASHHKGTHEIFISYDIPFGKFGVDNPRFF